MTVATFEMFLARVGDHARATSSTIPATFVLQQLDYLGFIDVYHERIRVFQSRTRSSTRRRGRVTAATIWAERAGRFRRSRRQVDFAGIFSKFAQYDYPGWAVLEWECCLKSPSKARAEGAPSSPGTSSR